MIPPFEPSTGYLPAGEHEATWSEIVERFGWTPWRRRLLDGLAESLDLRAEAGCHRVWLNGSFVTAKEEPGDFDAVWDPESVDDDALDPIFGPLGLLDERRLQKERFGGEWFPNLTERVSGVAFANFFQLATPLPRGSWSSTSRNGGSNDHQRVPVSKHQATPRRIRIGGRDPRGDRR